MRSISRRSYKKKHADSEREISEEIKKLTKYLVRRSMIQEGKEITLKEEERTAAQFSAEWALVEAT